MSTDCSSFVCSDASVSLYVACVLAFFVAGGFRLKYAEALDNADWRRKDEEEFLWSRSHSDGSSVLPQALRVSRSFCVLQERKKKTFSQKEGVTCQGLSRQSLSTCAWENLVSVEMIHCLAHTNPLPSLSVCLSFFCTEGWKHLTYYWTIRKLIDFVEILFCVEVSTEKSS